MIIRKKDKFRSLVKSLITKESNDFINKQRMELNRKYNILFPFDDYKPEVSTGDAPMLLAKIIENSALESISLTLDKIFIMIISFRIKKRALDLEYIEKEISLYYKAKVEELYQHIDKKDKIAQLGKNVKSSFYSSKSCLLANIDNEIKWYIDSKKIMSEISELSEGKRANRISLWALIISSLTLLCTLLIGILSTLNISITTLIDYIKGIFKG